MKVHPLLIRAVKPVGRAIAFVLLARRQFNLPRWTGRQEFVDEHNGVVAWLDSHFAALEHGAPWLHRFGTTAWDYCSGVVRSSFDISLTPRVHASVACNRNVTAVYGFDGDLTEHLSEVREALSTAGWTRSVWSTRAWVPEDSGNSLLWRPTAALGYPPGTVENPPPRGPRFAPSMWVFWSSRGQETPAGQNPHIAHANTRNYLVVESTPTDRWELSNAALENHDHALVVLLVLSYAKSDSPAQRRRIPRHLLPTRRARW